MSKQQMARKLIDLGCTKAFNTLRRYSEDKLAMMLAEARGETVITTSPDIGLTTEPASVPVIGLMTPAGMAVEAPQTVQDELASMGLPEAMPEACVVQVAAVETQEMPALRDVQHIPSDAELQRTALAGAERRRRPA